MTQNNALSPTQNAPGISLLQASPTKDEKYRIGRFENWIQETGGLLHSPDLPAYREDLLSAYIPSTAATHMSTIRGRYRRLVESNDLRSHLFALAGAALTASDRKAFVDETITRLSNAVNDPGAKIKVTKKQDISDYTQIRLTRSQAESLLSLPGTDTLRGLRDTAMIALMLCTGIREGELVALDVPDLRQSLGGELALEVRHGKGDKSRLIPYGELSWSLVIVDAWLLKAGITEGAVFRGLWQNDRLQGRIGVRSVEKIMRSYPVVIDGRQICIAPHTLRRTYARRQYDTGIDLVSLQQNLGHASNATTIKYIGSLGAESRRGRSAYSFDLKRLAK